MTDYSQITQALITGNETAVLAGVQTALDAGSASKLGKMLVI